MVSYNSSMHALQELLLKPLSSARQSNRSKKKKNNSKKNNNSYVVEDDNNNSSLSFYKCHITKISEDMSYLGNGVKYCFVEVTCNNGNQYGIQAFGHEAVELYKEALKHLSQEKEEEEEKSPVIYKISC